MTARDANINKYLLAIHLADGVGSVLSDRLLTEFPDPKEIFDAPIKRLTAIKGMSERIARNIKNTLDSERLKQELKSISEHKVTLITRLDPAYPANLNKIKDPPLVLYVQGRLAPEDINSVAIVGTRECSYYGMKMADYFARELAARGITVISGLARGIDSYAHAGALKEAKGRTIAVVASGLDIVYPSENYQLKNMIVNKGAVISELPMGTRPDRSNFPSRNRLISGLSLGVLIVEAPAKSGALITADIAFVQGRLVFAVPGRADDQGTKGNLRILKNGAKVVADVKDIIDELESLLTFRPKKDITPQNAVIEGDSADRVNNELEKSTPKGTPQGLSSEEVAVFNLLSDSPRYIDDLASELGKPVHIIGSVLLKLEILGLAMQLPGGMFKRAEE